MGSILAFAGASGAVTVWEFKFNETGTTTANTGTDPTAPSLTIWDGVSYHHPGDLHGVDGSGVGGLPGDRCLDFAAITNTHGGKIYPYSPPQTYIANSNLGAVISLTTMTHSCWVKLDTPLLASAAYANTARIADLDYANAGGGFGFHWTFGVTAVTTQNLVKYAIDGTSSSFDINSYFPQTATNKWFFLALTYDGNLSTNNVKLYLGTRTTSMVLIGTQTANQGGLNATNVGFSAFGAANGQTDLDGWGDNYRIDDAVLSLAQLDARRAADAPIPIMRVYSNDTAVANGDASPTSAKGTDFGSIDVTAGAVAHTFTATNSGLTNLILTGSTAVVITGNTGDFTASAPGSTNIPAGGSTTFTIAFDPSTSGLKTGLVSIANSDGERNPYTFNITGSGLAASEPIMAVYSNVTLVANGDTTPSAAEGTDFGTANVGVGLSHVFTITNSGLAALTLTNASPYATVSGDTGDFTVSVPPSTPIAAGAGTAFTVLFNPTAVGTRTGLVSIANNDADMTPYTFRIQGNGRIPAPVMTVYGNSLAITNGDTAPATADGTDFLGVQVSSGVLSRVFSITNTGDSALYLDGATTVAVAGNTADFSVAVPPGTTNIAAAGGTTFTIAFDPTAVGIRTALVTVANNDTNRNPYTFAIAGKGLAPQILWEFKFNEAGTNAPNTGTDGRPSTALLMRRHSGGANPLSDLHGSPRSGPSGTAVDRALDLSGISAHRGKFEDGTNGNPQAYVPVANCTNIQNLTAATFSGWFNAQDPITNGAYMATILFQIYDYQKGFRASFSTGNTNLNQITIIMDAGSYAFDISPLMPFTGTNTWYFWAVTYDGLMTNNNLRFYMGTRTSSVVQIGAAQSANYESLETVGSDFGINDAPNAGAGTFKGYQDNLRIANFVLPPEQLEAWRKADGPPPSGTAFMVK